MAYGRRKSYKKRPSFRKKRTTYRKKRAIRKAGSKLSRGIAPDRSLTVRLRYTDQVLTTSTLLVLNPFFNFQLSNCNNFANYSAIYDSYKVSKVCYKMIPPTTNIISLGTTGGSQTYAIRPQITSSLDWDSPGQTLTGDEVLSVANSKETSINKVHTRTFTPRLYGVIRRSSVSNGYLPIPMGLMDCGFADTVMSPTVNIQLPITDDVYTIKVEVSCIVTFMNNRSS